MSGIDLSVSFLSSEPNPYMTNILNALRRGVIFQEQEEKLRQREILQEKQTQLFLAYYDYLFERAGQLRQHQEKEFFSGFVHGSIGSS